MGRLSGGAGGAGAGRAGGNESVSRSMGGLLGIGMLFTEITSCLSFLNSFAFKLGSEKETFLACLGGDGGFGKFSGGLDVRLEIFWNNSNCPRSRFLKGVLVSSDIISLTSSSLSSL